MSVKTWFGDVWGGIKRNKPAILTIFGISLFWTGTALAIKATPKAIEAIDKKKKEEGHERLTLIQTIQATWKCYIFAFAASACGTACEIAALKEGSKRIAALGAAVEAGRNVLQEFRDYRKFVADKIGEKKEAEIHNQAVQEMVNRNPPPQSMADREIIEGQAPKPVCYEANSGRYFYVDYDTVAAAVNKLNNEILNGLNGYVSLNDFYEEIRMETTQVGDYVGWSTETGLIEIPEKGSLCYAGTPHGWPCWVLEFVNPPQYEYQYFRKH